MHNATRLGLLLELLRLQHSGQAGVIGYTRRLRAYVDVRAGRPERLVTEGRVPFVWDPNRKIRMPHSHRKTTGAYVSPMDHPDWFD